MRVLVTGSSGRIGRAIFNALAAAGDEPVGLDRAVFSTTHLVGDIRDEALMTRALDRIDAVVHAAALHAPHVGIASEAEFEQVNVEATLTLARIARTIGIERFVFTSTTALYGDASAAEDCSWIDEETPPQPRTIYHRTKLAAEEGLRAMASGNFAIRAIRMSRCFPEPADEMAVYRLHRGVDVRDVASAHMLCLRDAGDDFERYVISGRTPFSVADCETLSDNARAAIALREPELADAFDRRGWPLPGRIDRVYSPAKAIDTLGWRSRYDWREVIRQADSQDLEILPAAAPVARKSE